MDVLSLPEEIFEMIIAAADLDPVERRSTRLVSKRFAKSYTILSELFHSIYLVASITSRQWLNSDLLRESGIASYVRHITFVPPIHLPMTYEQYKDIFASQAWRKYGCYEDATPPRRSGRTRESRGSWNGPFLHSEKKLKTDFEEYEAHTVLDLVIFEGKHIGDNFVDVLRQCSRCTSFGFALVDYNMLGLDGLPMAPRCFRKSTLDVKRPDIHCDVEAAATFTEEFGAMAIDFMAQAGCVVTNLFFHQASMHYEEGFWDSLGLTRLNMSQLKELTFEPHVPLYDDEGHETMSTLQQKDIHNILSQSASTLQALTCYRANSLIWKGSPLPLPSLVCLVLGTCELSSQFLCNWIRAMPSLTILVLDGISLHDEQTHEDEPSGNWKRVFDTLRGHSTLFEGKLAFSRRT